MNVKDMSLLIWSVSDSLLRGVFKPSEYGSIILPFVVMRRLDCVLEPQKDTVIALHNAYKDQLFDSSQVILDRIDLSFFNTSNFDLSRIKSDPNNVSDPASVLKNFNNYVQGYSKNVLNILENFKINPLVEKLYKNKRLYKLIDKFTEFDLHPNKLDNHRMGLVYEELLRRFSEMSNEESGDHYTPRDIVKLLTYLLFAGDEENLQIEGRGISIFDPCCGTGGMLTIGKEWIKKHINPNLEINLYGQELNDTTYAICNSDLLMLGEDSKNIRGPASSLSNDLHKGRQFDYMITNPPFGVDWSKDKDVIVKESKDPNGRFAAGFPRISEGSLLFLQHLIHKMNPKGSRIGIILNGSPLFTGDVGSGESNIRRWIIENDWLESIVALPDRMFFNTPITTYIWIVTNKKSSQRQGHIQLIDGSSFFTSMSKNLGKKVKYINEEQIQKIYSIYRNNEQNDFCKIYPNSFFGYRKLRILDKNLKISKGNQEYLIVPLNEDPDEIFDKEIKPYLTNHYVSYSQDASDIGYTINFPRYFYKPTPINSVASSSCDLRQNIDKLNQLSKEFSDLHVSSNE